MEISSFKFVVSDDKKASSTSNTNKSTDTTSTATESTTKTTPETTEIETNDTLNVKTPPSYEFDKKIESDGGEKKQYKLSSTKKKLDLDLDDNSSKANKRTKSEQKIVDGVSGTNIPKKLERFRQIKDLF